MTNANITAPATTTLVAPNVDKQRLAHVAENFTMSFKDKTKAAILEEIKAAGFNLGVKSLTALLNGEKQKAGDFEIITVKFSPEEKAAKKAADLAVKEAAKIVATAAKEEAAKIAAKAKADKLVVESAAKKAPIDWGDLIAKTPQPVLAGSVIGRLFEMLSRPEGATKVEMMAEFNWSEGGFGGIIHWEPKARGYALRSAKIDGVLHYHLAFTNGVDVTPSEILYREKKVAAVAVPKAPKAPKVAATEAGETGTAANVTKRVRVPKDAMESVPAMGNVTMRRAATKHV
jgi:hypothetical protein